MTVDDQTLEYPRATFTEPLPHGYLYVGMRIDPPGGAPFVRKSRRRGEVLQECKSLARQLDALAEVVAVTVYEAVLIPPVKGSPQFDVMVLIQTTSPETIATVEAAEADRLLDADFVMAARNIRRIGDTERTRAATFLFNHFTASDAAGAVAAWEDLSGWYTAKTGADNSTLLQPTGEAPYAFINYVRLPCGAARFMLAQLSKPSFHTYVRRTLRNNGMVALPVLCKPV